MNALNPMTPSERAEVLARWQRDVTRARVLGERLQEVDAPQMAPAIVPPARRETRQIRKSVSLDRLDAIIEEAEAMRRDFAVLCDMLKDLRNA